MTSASAHIPKADDQIKSARYHCLTGSRCQQLWADGHIGVHNIYNSNSAIRKPIQLAAPQTVAGVMMLSQLLSVVLSLGEKIPITVVVPTKTICMRLKYGGSQ